MSQGKLKPATRDRKVYFVVLVQFGNSGSFLLLCVWCLDLDIFGDRERYFRDFVS